MQHAFSSLHLLQALIAFQGLLFALHLSVGKRGKRLPNRMLAALLALLAVQMVTNVARDLGHVDGIALPQLFGLLYGPLFYFYVRGLTHLDPRLGIEHVLHAAPFVALTIVLVTVELSIHTLAIGIFTSIGCYLFLASRALHAYRRVLVETHARVGEITLGWLRNATRMLTVLWCFDILAYTSDRVASATVERGVTHLLFVVLLIFVTTIVRKGLQHPELFAGITREDEAIAAVVTERADATEIDEHDIRRLDACMETEQPFLDPDLTLADLASTLGTTPRRLSRWINSHHHTNFSDFVNGYRITAARERLRDPDGGTILDILHAVGFNSKSAFNQAFKRRTGMTPSQYRDQQST
ncbi:MAG: helix-turn-helix transcriptional regulator [Acidobacteriota bacterium]